MTEDTDGDGIGEDTYYFSGNHEKNWVKFGGFYWRIIRTNEDGSVRMLYSGTSTSTRNLYTTTSAYNPTTPKFAVGYMYKTSNSGVDNSNSSKIKRTIDTWYENNLLTNYDKYISKTAIYCNDRSTNDSSTSSSESITYASNYRLQNKTPSYKCNSNGFGGIIGGTQDINDKFSVSTTSGGNGNLTYPIALITADERAYAGGVRFSKFTTKPYPWFYSNSSGDFAVYSSLWFTMSPFYYFGNTDTATMFVIESAKSNSGKFTRDDGCNYSDVEGAVRPVISLKACVKYSSGDGSSSNPYQVTIDSACESNEN